MTDQTEIAGLTIRTAQPLDVPVIHGFIRDLAVYERLSLEVEATEEALRETLFGPRPFAETILAEVDREPVGFALFFHTYRTFRGRPGIYLEDLFVRPHARGRRIGRALLAHLARLAVERGCAHLEWSVLNWNEPAIRFYRGLGAKPMDEWTVYRMSGPELRNLADNGCTEPQH